MLQFNFVTYSANAVASALDVTYLEVSNSTGEGVARLFEIALQTALVAKRDRDERRRIAIEEAEEAAPEGRNGGGGNGSKICTVL